MDEALQNAMGPDSHHSQREIYKRKIKEAAYVAAVHNIIREPCVQIRNVLEILFHQLPQIAMHVTAYPSTTLIGCCNATISIKRV